MHLTGTDRLREFAKRHADSQTALLAWEQTVKGATWATPMDVRSTYSSTDVAVPVASGKRVAVFNIRGNHYRLIASIIYPIKLVHVLKVMTHKEYSEDRWKEKL